MPSNIPQEHIYDSGISIPYPEDGVKGVYLQAFRAKGQDLENMIQFVKSTPINSLVIDVRDGYGQITMPLDTDNQLVKKHTVNEVTDTTALLKTTRARTNLSNCAYSMFWRPLRSKGKP